MARRDRARREQPPHSLFIIFSVAAGLLQAHVAAYAHDDAATAATGSPAPAEGARQAEVRERGAEVMPFALGKTLHTFDKNADGGIQRVRVRNAEPDQIALIRAHLHEIAASFASRDFTKPAHIHGADMPGLAQLRAAAPGELDVSYRDLDDGAEIAYTGHSAQTIDAIHRWFDAQLGDHGRDASTSAGPAH
jgi:hypothetical protein